MKLTGHFAGLISSRFAVVRDLFSLIMLEARLAGASLMPLLILLCIFFVLFMSFWLILIGLISYIFWILLGDILLVINIIFLLNLLLLFVILKSIKIRANRISFAKTREVLTNSNSKVFYGKNEKNAISNRKNSRKNTSRTK